MKNNLTKSDVLNEIETAGRELIESDSRIFRLWHKIKVAPSLWRQIQYSGEGSFWVIAIMGNHCLYFNPVEKGWGWGQYQKWGSIESYHWEQDDIHHILLKTFSAIDNGRER